MVTMRDFLKCLGIMVTVFSMVDGGDTPRPFVFKMQPEFPNTRIDVNDPFAEGKRVTKRVYAAHRRNSMPSGKKVNARKNSESVNLELVAIIREEIGRRNAEERAAIRRTNTQAVAQRTENRIKVIAAVGTAVVSVIGAIGTLIYHFNECGK